MNVTIVGGGGFIGKEILQYYCGGSVVVIDPRAPGGSRVGPRHREAVYGSDMVIHCACLDIYDSEEKVVRGYKDNFMSLVKTVEMMHRDARLVFLSSCSVYGDQGAGIVDEGARLQPFNHYSHAKAMAEEFLRIRRPKNTVVLRPSNVYGPGQVYPKHKGMIGKALYMKARGEPVVLYGNGSIIRDYTYVGDVAAAVYEVGKKDCGFGPFNVSTGVGTSTLDLVEKLEAPYHPDPTPPSGPRCRILSWGKLYDAVGWKPEVGLDEGLYHTVEANR